MHISSLLLIAIMATFTDVTRVVAVEGSWSTRWKEWFETKFKPCVRVCPRVQEFVCAYDEKRLRYAVASSLCTIQKQNACNNEDYQVVPVERCLVYLKFSPSAPTPSPKFPLPVMAILD